jgi:dTDP-4-dehydrorhamnose reductase
MKILILGGRGRLAAALAKKWSFAHDTVCLSRPELDAADIPALRRLLASREFDVLVNGTGLTNVDEC